MRVCSLCQRCYDDSVVSCTEKNHPVLSKAGDGSCEMIAGYHLESLLESVGKSATYRARQMASAHSCIIKILAADEKNKKQFLDEANIAAAFFHPNVADIYENGILDSGEAYVVTEEAIGQTLGDILNVSAPSLLTAIQVARQTAEALHALHMNGLTHRAVNPANIVLTADPEQRLFVKIQNIDFAGVREESVISDRFLGETGLNSLKYFAPEQCSGEEVSRQTDVYSLGVVFYEMLAGVPPFQGASAAALIHGHRNQPPPEIKIANFDLRMLLTHTLMESLQKRPGSRHSSAFAFASQVRHIEQLATHSSTPPPVGIVPSRPSTQQKATAAVVLTTEKPVQPVPFQTAAIDKRKDLLMEIGAPVVTAEVQNNLGAVVNIEIEPVVSSSINNQRAVATEVENELVAAKIKSEPAPPTEVEGGSVISLKAEREAVSTANLDIPVLDLQEIPEISDLLSEEPFIENFVKAEVAFTPQRSRLRRQRRKLRAKSAAVPHNIQESECLPVVESTGMKHVQVQAKTMEVPVVQLEPERSAVAPVCNKSTKVEWEQPEGDIPSEADVLEVLLKEQITEIPVVQAGPEEITFVRSKPIRIEWERPRAPQDFLRDGDFASRVLDEAEFFPTILGERVKKETIDPDRRDPIFLAFDDQSRSHYRSLMIGGVFVALIILILFGEHFVMTYVQTGSSGDPVSARAIPAQETPSLMLPASTVSPPTKGSLKSLDKPLPIGDADADRSKPGPVKDRVSFSSGRSHLSTSKAGGQNRTPKTTAVSQNVGIMSPLPSTLVIYSDNGQVKSKNEPENKTADKKTHSIKDGYTYLTRPRIVKDPRP